MTKQSLRRSVQLLVICTLFAGALGAAGITHARDYLIEVVLFENVEGRELTAGGLYYPKLGRSLRLGTDDAVAAGYVPLEQNLSLAKNAASIAASSRYRLIRHLAWRQPGLDEKNAIPVRISLGDTISMYLPESIDEYDEFIPASSSAAPERTRQVKTSTVNGSIKVHLGRFLHLEALLVFTDPDTQQSFRLSQSRKMRSRELHYIDNPRFGLLTRILPVDDPEGSVNEQDTPAAENASGAVDAVDGQVQSADDGAVSDPETDSLTD